jgi:hypothetical protein
MEGAVGGSKFEIRNQKFELFGAPGARFVSAFVMRTLFSVSGFRISDFEFRISPA